MILDRLVVALDAQTQGLTRGFDRALSSVDATSRSLVAAAARAERGIESSFSRAGRSASDLGDRMQNVGGRLSMFVTAPIAGLGAVAVRNAARLDSLTRGLQAVTDVPVGPQLERLREIAKLPGLGFEEAIQGSVNLQAVGFSAAESERTLRAFGNAVATTGGGKAELDRVITQLTQMSSAGKILTADLRPMIQTSPLIASALRDMFGTINPEEITAKLEASGQSFDDFLGGLTAQLETLPQVTAGPATAMESLGDSFTVASGALGDRLMPGVIAITGALSFLMDGFTGLDPTLQTLIVGLGATGAALGPLLFGLGGLVKLLPLMQAGMGVLGLTGGPVLLAAAAFGTMVAAGLAVIENWGVIRYEGGRLVAALQELFSESILGKTFDAVVGGVGRVTEAFRVMYDRVVGHSYVPDMVTEVGGQFGILRRTLDDGLDAVVAWATGSGDALGAFVKRALADLARLVLKMALVEGLKAALSGATGGVGGFVLSAITPRATGGPVSAGHLYQVNERGPELFVPNVGGTMMAATAGGGGGAAAFLAALGPLPQPMTPNEVRTHAWYRDAFRLLMDDYRERS